MMGFRKFLIAAYIIGISALSAGCSVNPATGQSNFNIMSAAEEKKVGSEQHPKVMNDFGGSYLHDDLNAYIDDLGQRLAKVSELPDITWTFTILDDDVINAFALPGGYVYISRGLITLAESEAELAAVLGHEIGHVTARHTAQRYSQSKAVGLGAAVLGAVLGGPFGDLGNYAGQAYLAGYSRSQESEADLLGMRYMTKLGYDPRAVESFFHKLAGHTELEAKISGHETTGHMSLFASHPDTQKRIADSKVAAKSYLPGQYDWRRDVFLNHVEGVEFGDSIRHGLVRGQEFIHPQLGLRFEVPAGFKIENQPSQVVAQNKAGVSIVFDMDMPKEQFRSASQYLTKGWSTSLELLDVEAIDVNGLPSATGRARITRSGQMIDLRLVALKYGDRYFRFAFLAPAGQMENLNMDLRRTTYSFQLMSAREANAVKPLRIRVRPVPRKAAYADFVGQMKTESHQEEWFQLINMRQVENAPQSGDRVKVVAY